MRRRLLYHKLSKTEKELIWNTPVVNLSYSPSVAPSSGTTMNPIVSWTQTAYYSNDPSSTAESLSGTSASEYEYTGSLNINTSTGVVTVDSTVIETEQTLGTVTAKVTSNSKTGYSDTYTIIQEAYVPDEPEPEPEPEPKPTNLSMDVVFWNKEDRHRYFVNKNDWSIDKYPATTYEPLGIVVIPASHERYGNNTTIGVISMMDASLSSPKTGEWGNNTPLLSYGDYSIDADSNNYLEVRTFPITGIPYNVKDAIINDEYQGVINDNSLLVYFPSDTYDKLSNTLDTKTYYSLDTFTYGAPSPYYNEIASSIYGNSNNDTYCFGLFDGNERSLDYMMRLYKTGLYEDWLNDNEIPGVNSLTPSDKSWTKVLPAMEACWRYSPFGNNEGGWYLPSVGELGYVMARKQAINDTISALQEAYHKNDSTTYAEIGSEYLTSTEFNNSDSTVRSYAIGIGEVVHAVSTQATSLVRPFKSISGASNYGDLGIESIPQKLSKYANVEASDEAIDVTISRWCVMREGTSNESPYPEGKIVSGIVYGVLVNGQNDFTVLQKDIELFSISNLKADYYNDEVEEVGKNYGYYNNDIESGWYLVQKIICTDEDGKEYTIDNLKNVNIGVTLTKDDWLGYASICYKYPYMGGVYFDCYAEFPYNNDLYAFRIGYWNYKTVIYFHGTKHYDEDIVVPQTYKDLNPTTFNFPSFKYGDNITWISEDETNVVRTLCYGGRIHVELRSSGTQTVGILFGYTSNGGNTADLTFAELTNNYGNSYLGVRLEVRLYKNEDDTTPYDIKYLMDTVISESTLVTYRDIFLQGISVNYNNAIVNEECYAELAFVIKSVNINSGDTIIIHSNEVEFGTNLT